MKLREILYLRPGELARTWPFFAVYLLLSAAFTLADGVSLALFVEEVGAPSLPLAYAATASVNFVLIGAYVLFAERFHSARLFQALLAVSAGVFVAAWLVLPAGGGGPHVWYGALFVTREVAYTLVLMHFGTYLQDYFTRDQLDRVLPLVYAGGRVGGIAGGAMLQWLIRPLGPTNAALGFAVLCAAGVAALEVLKHAFHRDRSGDEPSDPDALAEGASEDEARSSVLGFLRFAWSSPLLFWASVSSLLFMLCRWLLNYRYSGYFQEHFDGPIEVAEFVGRYTQIALLASLVIQLLVVNRAVARVGVGGAYFGYAALVLAGALFAAPSMTLGAAVFARFLETELRLGLRNPLMQLISNRFSRPLRLRVRAWTMGLLTPLGTGLASLLLGLLAALEVTAWAGWVGAGVALAFVLSAAALARHAPAKGEKAER